MIELTQNAESHVLSWRRTTSAAIQCDGGLATAADACPGWMAYDTTLGPVLIQVKNSLGLRNVGTASRPRLSPAFESIPQIPSQREAVRGRL